MIPVDDFEPKTKDSKTKLSISMPLIPALDRPMRKEAKEIMHRVVKLIGITISLGHTPISDKGYPM